MPEKNPPSVVALKKIWIGLALMGALSLSGVILYNLYHSAVIQPKNTAHKAHPIQTWVNSSDMNWYRTQMPPQPKLTVTGKVIQVAVKVPSESVDQSRAVTDPDRVKAMSVPISSNQIVAESSHKTGAENTNKVALKNPSSPYVIQAGTLIPGILMTGINSDLPGQIIGQVRSHVYDSIQGRTVLIPQGSKLIGVYDAKIIYGQERVLVVWQRLILPNGQSMDLAEMAGVDNSGYAGFNDRVNTHTGKLLGSAILMSVLGAGAQLSQPQADPTTLAGNPITPALSQNVAASVMTTASELTSKNLNVQPTLEIRPGYTFNVSVTKDMVFPKPDAIAGGLN